MNKIYLLSSILPSFQKEWIVKNSIGAISNANDNFQRALISGFQSNNVEVEIINVPNIGAFPFRFKKIYNPNIIVSEDEKIKGNSIGFINISLIKHHFIYKNLRDSVLVKNKMKVLVIYDLYLPFLKVLKDIKLANHDVKVILVVPDIYGFTGYAKGFFHRLLTRNEEKEIYDKLSLVDGFILLTKSMLDKLPSYVIEKPYEIIEGIIDVDLSDFTNSPKIALDKKKVILYSGAIEKRHGLLNLITAFCQGSHDAELHFYGNGSDLDELKLFCIKNSNIKFFGQQSRKVILEKQREAFLLINPRTSDGEFTKYSFPSKILEYFNSGTPTLMYKLDGIPEEYYKYCFVPIDESVNALSEKIGSILELDRNDLAKIGFEAKKFVNKYKNSTVQVGKIINLIQKL